MPKSNKEQFYMQVLDLKDTKLNIKLISFKNTAYTLKKDSAYYVFSFLIFIYVYF